MKTNLTQQNIPRGWKFGELGNFLADIGDGGTPLRSKTEYFGGEIPWVVVNDIQPHIKQTKNTLTKEGFQKSSAKLWPTGSVILSFGATIGEVGIADVPVTTKQGIAGIIPNNDLLNIYLYYLLLNKKALLHKLSSGSTIKEVRPLVIKKQIEVLIPPIKEQQKISEILGVVDEDIAKTQEVIEATEKLKHGLSRQLFTRGVNDGIEELMLGNISTVTSSKRIMRSEYVESGIPFYRSKEVIEKAKGIKHDSVFYISKERYKEIEQKFGAPHIGDILMTAVGTIGVVYLVDEKEFYFKDGNLLWIKDINRSLNKSYLKYYMNSEIFQKRVLGTAIGSNQKALTIEKVEKVIVPIPKLQEQQKIVDILSAVDEKISVNKKLKTKLTLLKKGLMQDLLSGKVRVKI